MKGYDVRALILLFQSSLNTDVIGLHNKQEFITTLFIADWLTAHIKVHAYNDTNLLYKHLKGYNNTVTSSYQPRHTMNEVSGLTFNWRETHHNNSSETKQILMEQSKKKSETN